MKPSSVSSESTASSFCSVALVALETASHFFASRAASGGVAHDADDVSLGFDSAAAYAVGFFGLSVDFVASSSSLDFCPSGDLARPSRYLHVARKHC